MLIDALVGLAVVLALTATVAITAHWERRASDGLADTRAATAAAEAALATGDRLEPVAGGVAVPGHHWARATAVVNGHSVSLVGLVNDGGRR